MKRLFALLSCVSLLFSCAKETDPVTGPGKGAVLYAEFAENQTKTAFDGTSFVWKNGDRIRVASTDGGTMDFKYEGEDTPGAAKFVETSASGLSVQYGDGGFAIYPSLSAANCVVEGNSLVLSQKNNYSWFDGNVEAPMIAKVEAGKTLSFTHLGGLLKIIVENIPASAAKLMVKTPGYATSKAMPVHGWDGRFTETYPYVQAYEGTDGLTGLPFQAGGPDTKVFYVPLPVGPGADHKYPEIDVYLVNAGGAVISGTERTARNVRIERATVKTMAPITLDPVTEPFTVTTLFGRVGNSTAVSGKAGGGPDEAVFGSLRGIGWIKEDHEAYLLEQSQTVRILDLDNMEVSDPYTYGENGYVPWLGTVKDGLVWFAEKAKAKVYTFDPRSGDFNEKAALSDWASKSVMDIKFDGAGNAYVAVRDRNTIYKYADGDFTRAPVLSIDLGKWPLAMEFDTDGSLMVATNGCQILKVDPVTGSFEAVAGILDAKAIDDGTSGAPLTAKFTAGIGDIAFAPDGDLYVGDTYRIRRITKGASGWSDATVSTVAGGARQTNRNNIADGVGTAATFNQIGGLLFSSDGETLYITDQGSCHIRKMWIGNGGGSAGTSKPAFRAATFNIRFLTDKDTGERSWESRKDGVVSTVTDNGFDVVGFQESTAAQKVFLKASLPGYTFSDSKEEPCIAFKSDKFDLTGEGCFYLSSTPDVPSSPYPGWVDTDPGRKRICQWVSLQEKDSGKSFVFMNTHLEVKSSGTQISEEEAVTIRTKSAELISSRAKALSGGAPVILVGDMNSAVTEAAHTDWFKKNFTDAYYRSSDLGVRSGPVATYNAYSYEADQKSKWYARCDYVYYNGAIDVVKYQVSDAVYGSFYPSDHWPVIVVFSFN